MVRKVLMLFTSAVAVTALVGCSSDAKTTTSSAPDSASEASAPSSEDGTDSTSDATDTTSGAASGDERIDAVVDRILRGATEGGLEFDRECVATAVGQLTEADLELLFEASKDTAPDATAPTLSDEGEAIGDGLGECIVPGAGSAELVEDALAKIQADGSNANADEDCLRTQLGKLTDIQLQAVIDAEPDTTDPIVGTAVFTLLECVDPVVVTETTG